MTVTSLFQLTLLTCEVFLSFVALKGKKKENKLGSMLCMGSVLYSTPHFLHLELFTGQNKKQHDDKRQCHLLLKIEIGV